MSTLIENVAKVTAAHAALKTAISAKGVTVPEGAKLTDMPALVGKIQAMPAPTNQRMVFAYDTSTNLVVQNPIVVDLTTVEDLAYCFFQCSSLTSLTLPAGFGQNATALKYCFNYCSRLTSLTLPAGFGQNATDLSFCFSNCSEVTSLALPAGFAQNATTASACFYRCLALTDITGNPNFKVSVSLSDSTNLTHDSLMVIINGLQTVTETQTLTLGTTNLAKLAPEEKAVATDKGWELA